MNLVLVEELIFKYADFSWHATNYVAIFLETIMHKVWRISYMTGCWKTENKNPKIFSYVLELHFKNSFCYPVLSILCNRMVL